jgi:RNA ligase
MIVTEAHAIADLAARMRSRGIFGDWSDLAAEHVRVKPHATLPIALFDYGEAANYQRTPWTPLQIVSRGLVLADDGTLIARPFPKFFSVGEQDGLTWDDLFANWRGVSVAPKYDGSLVILYWYEGKWIVQSRGGWTNFVTEAAHERIGRLYAKAQRHWPKAFTLMCELTLHDRPVIVDCETNLRLIGARHLSSGKLVPPSELPSFADRYRLPHAAEPIAILPQGERLVVYRSLADRVRQNEGWVATFDNGLMVKIKTRWYLTIQRAMKMATPRVILQRLRDETFEDWRLIQPYELRPWIDHVAGVMRSIAQTRIAEARRLAEETAASGALKGDQVAYLKRVASDTPTANMAISLLTFKQPTIKQAIIDLDIATLGLPPITLYLDRLPKEPDHAG